MPTSATTPRRKIWNALFSNGGTGGISLEVGGILFSFYSPTPRRYSAAGTAGMGNTASADGNWVFMANSGSPGGVSTYGVTNGLIVGSVGANASVSCSANLYGVYASGDGNKFAVLGGTNGQLWNNTSRLSPTSIANISIDGARSGAFTPDGTKLIIGGTSYTNNAYIINTATGAISSTIALGAGGWGVCVSPDGTKAYVSLAAGDIKVINIASATVTGTLTSTGSSKYLAITPDGSKLLVPKDAANSLHVINTSDGTMAQNISFTTTYATTINPFSVAVSPDGKIALIGCTSSNLCWMNMSNYNCAIYASNALDGGASFNPQNVCWIAR